MGLNLDTLTKPTANSSSHHPSPSWSPISPFQALSPQSRKSLSKCNSVKVSLSISLVTLVCPCILQILRLLLMVQNRTTSSLVLFVLEQVLSLQLLLFLLLE